MTGYSGTPLSKKLGLTDGLVIFVFGMPPDYLDWISPLPKGLVIRNKLSGELDFVHLFARESTVFQREFQRAKAHLKKSGMIWVSWPKKSAKVSTDLDENVIRAFGLQEGLVDVKVCAVDAVWSGLKFVYRLKDRPE